MRMERSFEREVRLLAKGDGDVFHGEGILAVTKALLQSGVSYVGGYQGSPVSQLLDVMVQAREYLDTLGVHVEPCTNEAAACAMLAASVNYPVRGAVTWKSIVGTNVASDALSNLASPGVRGGALIVVGEDYGDGSSVVQERTHAFAMKSSLCLLDPRPELPQIVRMVEHAFALSEASATPAILQLRIRACHLQGSFACKDNVAPAVSGRHPLQAPAPFDGNTMSHPPYTFEHERLKVEERLPAARRYIAEHRLNETFGGDVRDVGIVVQGGLYNNLSAALATAGFVDGAGASRIPLLVLNVTYPLVPDELVAFCAGKRAVLVLEEGHPEFIEFELAATLSRAEIPCAVRGKATMVKAGEYTVERLVRGVARFAEEFAPSLSTMRATAWRDGVDAVREQARALLAAPVPARPPGFCIGCPERPVFSALKLAERRLGSRHVAADIGCHSFAMFEPFMIGNSITGYGMGLASAAAVAPLADKRPLATVGDGGFWHNGFLSGVTSAVKNGTDSVLLIFKNGYTSATGTQELVSTPAAARRDDAGGRSTTATDTRIEDVVRGVGVQWLRTVHTYDVARMQATLEDAFTTQQGGLKVVVAEGECQLERQRRLRAQAARERAAGTRATRVRYGIDETVCTGDRACIRLSGCPSLTLKASSHPLRIDPVTTVTADCVGCGLCGELAQTAALCPSFYRTEVIAAPTAWERFIAGVRALAMRALLVA
jgi:indolepyruvate ferredoxin oxidoreductase alpha subunit